MTKPTGTTFIPLDLWCPACHAAPGCRCVWNDAGTMRSRRPHAERVSAARDATAASRRRAR